jgi:hypothetical protein
VIMDLYCKAINMEISVNKSYLLYNGVNEEL